MDKELFWPEIMLGAEMAEGSQLSHMQGIVNSATVKVGRNLTIRQNTTIGSFFKGSSLLIGDS